MWHFPSWEQPPTREEVTNSKGGYPGHSCCWKKSCPLLPYGWTVDQDVIQDGSPGSYLQ